MRRAALLLALAPALLGLLPGCYASNVVAKEDRAVQEEVQQRTWRAADAADLSGFFASTGVEGEAAGALLKAYYYFGPDAGHYSGAVLALTEGGPRFLVLAEDGEYTFADGRLDLRDGSQPAEVEASEGHLRLKAEGTTITLERVELR